MPPQNVEAPQDPRAPDEEGLGEGDAGEAELDEAPKPRPRRSILKIIPIAIVAATGAYLLDDVVPSKRELTFRLPPDLHAERLRISLTQTGELIWRTEMLGSTLDGGSVQRQLALSVGAYDLEMQVFDGKRWATHERVLEIAQGASEVVVLIPNPTRRP